MKYVRIVLGFLLIATGLVWFLQGINLLPGSFMTGDIRWAIAGIVAATVGLALLVWPRRQEEEDSQIP